ncbi:unnamed protein product [Ixodes persulcatus]
MWQKNCREHQKLQHLAPSSSPPKTPWKLSDVHFPKISGQNPVVLCARKKWIEFCGTSISAECAVGSYVSNEYVGKVEEKWAV